MSEISISIISSPEFCVALSELLVEVVANSGCVSFMHPRPPPVAIKFWESSLAAAARGERIVFGAWHATNLIGTVTPPLDCPPNQPHRAEIAKLMRRIDHRQRGVATALMRAAEAITVQLAHGAGARYRGRRKCIGIA